MKKFVTRSWQDMKKAMIIVAFVTAALFLVLGADGASAQSTDPVQSGSVGLTGTISAPPPSQGAQISFPTNGQSFGEVPIVVTGICPAGLLVKIFKNNVFAGSVQCIGGNFSLQTDLFVGTNELIARVYDDLDQPGPDSNVVSVSFNSSALNTPTRVSLTSNFAKRGANPGETLTWPISLSGGLGPYAFSVDWGDKKEPDLFTRPFPGTVELSHVFDEPGVYNIIIKVVDANGTAAFLQLVGIANGPLSQSTDNGVATDGDGTFTKTRTKIVWWPSAFIVPFAISTFWLGKKYMVRVMKKRIEQGEHPFADF
jgi:hypothetical protein